MEFTRQNYSLAQLAAPALTAVGAWGGFPQPPIWFTQLAENEVFKYTMLYILLLQGLGEQNPKTSLAFTIIFYLIKKFLDKPLPDWIAPRKTNDE